MLIKFSFCVVGTLLLCHLHLQPTAALEASHYAQHRNLHIIVIDAGSTGTRMNYYIFEKNEAAPFKLTLQSRITRRTQPGLSAFQDDPGNAYKSIVEMIDSAKVPRDGADLLVKATAGIRLLAQKNASIADAIMKSIQEKLNTTYQGSLFVCARCVGILPGLFEGDYAWLAVNFLSGNSTQTDTLGVMDLGGASTQITFEWNDRTKKVVPTMKNVNDTYVYSFKAVGKEFQLYSHSYLGLGMQAQKLASLNVTQRCRENNCLKEEPYTSPCLHANFRGEVSIGAAKVRVAGESGAIGNRFKECLKSVKVAVKHQVRPVSNKKKLLPTFVLQSGFYSTMYFTGLITDQGGDLNLETIVVKAKSVCERVVAQGAYAPYDCMNYCYVINLLRSGYQLAYNQPFRVVNMINGHSPDWALGLAVKEAYAHAYGLPQ